MKRSGEIYRSRINKVIDHVNHNLDKSFSIEELASVAHFSPYHFHRIFVAVTGESVNNFTIRARLEKSARLLRFSKDALTTIALDCGFSSSSTFSRSFRQYFGLPPGSYRKTGKIENSKICKELFPLTQYHCNMSVEEMEASFPVELREFPQRRIAYIRIRDSFREGVVLKAFDELGNWAKANSLFDSETIFGMSVDDVMITPKEKYRYEACITIPEALRVSAGDPVETMILPPCKYAVVKASGDFGKVAAATYYLFNHWLINSSYEPEHQPGLEIFCDNRDICNWEHFNLELCIPVKNINSHQ